MAKKQVFGFELAPRLEQVDDTHSERVQDRNHRYQLCDDSALPYQPRLDRIFGKVRLAGLKGLSFDQLATLGNTFDGAVDAVIQESIRASRKVVDQGAEIIIAPRPSAALLARNNIFEVDSVPVLDTYSLLMKMTEALVVMHWATGTAVSRRRLYRKPDAELVQRGAKLHNIATLLDGND